MSANFPQSWNSPAGQATIEDDDFFIESMMRQMGVNTGPTASRFDDLLARTFSPVLNTVRGNQPFQIGGQNAHGGRWAQMMDLAQQLRSGGQGVFDTIRGHTEQAINSDQFRQTLSGLSPEEQQQMMLAQQPGLYAGYAPVVQQAAVNHARQAIKDVEMARGTAARDNTQGPDPIFLNYLRQRAEVDPNFYDVFGLWRGR